jgi:hypothetical protein
VTRLMEYSSVAITRAIVFRATSKDTDRLLKGIDRETGTNGTPSSNRMWGIARYYDRMPGCNLRVMHMKPSVGARAN